MDEDGLVFDTGVDRFKVEPLPHKRVLTYVNHFVLSTASFLNHFSATCEQKLADVAFRLQRLEITLALLENKLDSIEGLGTVTAAAYVSTTQTPVQPVAAPAPSAAPAAPAPAAPAAPQPAAAVTAAAVVSEAAAAPPPPLAVMTVRQDPRFSKYFKMVEMGVPFPAVQNKFAAETGMNPAILANPDAPVDAVAGGTAAASRASANDSDDSKSESDDDFSEDEEDEAAAGGSQPNGGAPPGLPRPPPATAANDSGSEAEFSD